MKVQEEIINTRKETATEIFKEIEHDFKILQHSWKKYGFLFVAKEDWEELKKRFLK